MQVEDPLLFKGDDFAGFMIIMGASQFIIRYILKYLVPKINFIGGGKSVV